MKNTTIKLISSCVVCAFVCAPLFAQTTSDNPEITQLQQKIDQDMAQIKADKEKIQQDLTQLKQDRLQLMKLRQGSTNRPMLKQKMQEQKSKTSTSY